MAEEELFFVYQNGLSYIKVEILESGNTRNQTITKEEYNKLENHQITKTQLINKLNSGIY